jgi:endoribonuclease L-PSP
VPASSPLTATGTWCTVANMRGQIGQTLDNLETVLQAAGFGLGDVVRLNYYTTDVDACIEAMAEFGGRLAAANCRPASTLLGVSRLVFPGQLVELEGYGLRLARSLFDSPYSVLEAPGGPDGDTGPRVNPIAASCGHK